MQNCKNCGAEMQDDDLFCGYCGTCAGGNPAAETQPRQKQAATAQPQPAPEYAQTPGPVQMQPTLLKKVTLKSPFGAVKTVPVGFSVTTFFFWPFVAIYRKDWKFLGAFILYIAIWNIFSSLVMPNNLSAIYNSPYGIFGDLPMIYWIGSLIFLIFDVIVANKYNAFYIKGLLAKGWQPYGPDDSYTLIQKKIM